MKKTLTIYHYFYTEQYYVNLLFFLAFGINEESTYVILSSSNFPKNINVQKNITVIELKNYNYDFGAYSTFISQNPHIIKKYNYFCFLNCTSRGPFLLEQHNIIWQDSFLKKLSNIIKLIGSTENNLTDEHKYSKLFRQLFPQFSSGLHVQSNIFCMDDEALLFLYSAGFFDEKEKLTKERIITDYEIRLSQMILENGWEITSLNKLSIPKNFPPLNGSLSLPKSFDGDFLKKGRYLGRSLTPFELIFIKTGRDLISNNELNSFTMSAILREHNKIDYTREEIKQLKMVLFND